MRARPKRGKAGSTTQLSELQRAFLMWLYDRESEHDPQVRKRGSWIGIPCSSKQYYDDAPTMSQKSSLSTALKRLEERSLITRHNDVSKKNGHKTHVKFTALGRKEAQRLKDNSGKSRRELDDARSGLQKWVLRCLLNLKVDLAAQIHVDQNWSAYRTNMHLPLGNLSDRLNEEQIEEVESTIELSLNLDNKYYIAETQVDFARFEKLANDPRLQNGSFPLETMAEVLKYTYKCYTDTAFFLSGLESLQIGPEQLAFLAEDVPKILEKFDLTVDSFPAAVYRYVDSITVYS